jgi:glycosyltransferase involved in cell wall biosynthesis
MFTYWGRRGISQLVLELARTAAKNPNIEASFSISRQNEACEEFAQFGDALLAIDTFSAGRGAVTEAWRIPGLRRQLANKIRDDGVTAVVEIMPHVWSPLVMPAAKAAGAAYVTIVHDADRHPGDRTSWVKPLLDKAAAQADAIVALSQSVATKLSEAGSVPAATLFVPDLGNAQPQVRRLTPGSPWRLLFLGRIMSYKGLPLCIETVNLLRRNGHDVRLGVFGEGDLGGNQQALAGLGAEVVNRWLSAAEIEQALQSYDAVILSYVEASQSGVAAAALGAGVPTIATPVGGLREQVVDGATGVLSERIDADSLAEAVVRLFDPPIYDDICRKIVATHDARSMDAFLDALIKVALRVAPSS